MSTAHDAPSSGTRWPDMVVSICSRYGPADRRARYQAGGIPLARRTRNSTVGLASWKNIALNRGPMGRSSSAGGGNRAASDFGRRKRALPCCAHARQIFSTCNGMLPILACGELCALLYMYGVTVVLCLHSAGGLDMTYGGATNGEPLINIWPEQHSGRRRPTKIRLSNGASYLGLRQQAFAKTGYLGGRRCIYGSFISFDVRGCARRADAPRPRHGGHGQNRQMGGIRLGGGAQQASIGFLGEEDWDLFLTSYVQQPLFMGSRSFSSAGRLLLAASASSFKRRHATATAPQGARALGAGDLTHDLWHCLRSSVSAVT